MRTKWKSTALWLERKLPCVCLLTNFKTTSICAARITARMIRVKLYVSHSFVGQMWLTQIGDALPDRRSDSANEVNNRLRSQPRNPRVLPATTIRCPRGCERLWVQSTQ